MPAVTRSSLKRGATTKTETIVDVEINKRNKRVKDEDQLEPVEALKRNVNTDYWGNIIEEPPTPIVSSPSLASRTGIPAGNLDHLIEEFQAGLRHIMAVDPRLIKVIHEAKFLHFHKTNHNNDNNSSDDGAEEKNYFQILARGIIGQQVSGAAARSIANKFIASFQIDDDDDNAKRGQPASTSPHSTAIFPSPQQVVDAPVDQLRSAGLSGRKVEYLQCLAQAFLDRRLTGEFLRDANDEAIVERLVSIKGIGPWSAEMFLLFGLIRMDVFSLGDLGIRRGLANYLKFYRSDLVSEMRENVDWETVLGGKYAKPGSRKYPKMKLVKGVKPKWQEPGLFELEYVAEMFKPYRTAFMLVLWELSRIDLGILTDRTQV